MERTLTEQQCGDEVEVLGDWVAQEAVVDHGHERGDDQHHNPRIVVPPDFLQHANVPRAMGGARNGRGKGGGASACLLCALHDTNCVATAESFGE